MRTHSKISLTKKCCLWFSESFPCTPIGLQKCFCLFLPSVILFDFPDALLVIALCFFCGGFWGFLAFVLLPNILFWSRVAGLGRLSAGAKMTMKPFVKRVFTIFATNASFLCVISNFRILLSKICNIYHVIVHFLPKKHCFYPKRHFLCPKISKKSA